MSIVIAQRYAKAFYNEYKNNNKIVDDMRYLIVCIRESEAFSSFIKNPIYTDAEAADCIDSLFSKSLQKETIQFLKFVHVKNRINYLETICKCYIELYRQDNGISKIIIETAFELSEAKIKAIAKEAEKRFDKKIESKCVVKPNLLGGIRVIHDNEVFDFSLNHELNNFKEKIITA